MKKLTGTYFNGQLILDQPFDTEKPVRVSITLEDSKKDIKLSDFSFAETQKLLKDCKSSFSDEVIAERRKEL